MAGLYGGFLGNEGGMARQAFGMLQPGSMIAGNPSFDINQNRQPGQPGMGSCSTCSTTPRQPPSKGIPRR